MMISHADFDQLSPQKQSEWIEKAQAPYLAANGHTMQRHLVTTATAQVAMDATASCTEDCAACGDGESLPDW